EQHQAGGGQREAAVERIAPGTAQRRAAAHAVGALVGPERRHDLEHAAAEALAQFRAGDGIHDQRCSSAARPAVSSATASLAAATWPATVAAVTGLAMLKVRVAVLRGRLNSTAACASSCSMPLALSTSSRWMLT